MIVADPFAQFAEWFAAAGASEPNDHNAMALATADAQGRPATRIVLLKAWDERGFVFYTNLDSRKGRELAANPFVQLGFHWKSRGRQVRIDGRADRVAEADADAYFATRPRASQLGAWASEQSQLLASRELFEARLAEAETRFDGVTVPRPPHWSGFRVVPHGIEFWEARDYRHHDRIRFTPSVDGWAGDLLFP